ncbi:DUF397 domain-containing protein [Streptomyces sp. NPDC047123]|uniref:DUF397 domain-containing protein n=1 Tax=Streptomyces sp. NPDC047123 TaxID=3155622 RepID=UPI0033CF3A2D
MRNHNPEREARTATWFTSSHSDASGGNCPEVGAWRKSTYSAGDGGDCLEVLDGHPDVTPVRDSKNPRGPRIPFRTAAWSAFVAHLKEN